MTNINNAHLKDSDLLAIAEKLTSDISKSDPLALPLYKKIEVRSFFLNPDALCEETGKPDFITAVAEKLAAILPLGKIEPEDQARLLQAFALGGSLGLCADNVMYYIFSRFDDRMTTTIFLENQSGIPATLLDIPEAEKGAGIANLYMVNLLHHVLHDSVSNPPALKMATRFVGRQDGQIAFLGQGGRLSTVELLRSSRLVRAFIMGEVPHAYISFIHPLNMYGGLSVEAIRHIFHDMVERGHSYMCTTKNGPGYVPLKPEKLPEALSDLFDVYGNGLNARDMENLKIINMMMFGVSSRPAFKQSAINEVLSLPSQDMIRLTKYLVMQATLNGAGKLMGAHFTRYAPTRALERARDMQKRLAANLN